MGQEQCCCAVKETKATAIAAQDKLPKSPEKRNSVKSGKRASLSQRTTEDGDDDSPKMDDPLDGGRRKSIKKRKSSVKMKRRSTVKEPTCEDFLAQKIVEFEMTPDIKEELAKCLVTKLACFKLENKEAKQLAKEMKLFRFSSGDHACKEGETGTYFFVIHEGEFHVSTNGNVVATLGSGIGFGEIALVHGCPRTASVQAVADGASAWGVDRTTFRYQLEKTEAKSYEDNRRFVDSVKLLDGLSNEQKNKLTELAMITQVFEAEQTVVAQGQEGRCMYILKSGECSVILGGTKNPKTLLIEGGKEVARVREGECFGERALIFAEPRGASVKALVKSELLCLDHTPMKKALGPDLDSLLRRNLIKYALKGESAVFSHFSHAQQNNVFDQMEDISAQPNEAIKKPLRFFVVVDGALMVTGATKGADTAIINRGKVWGDEYILDMKLPANFEFVAGPKGAVVASLTAEGLSKALKKSGFAEGANIQAALDQNFRVEVASKHWIFRHLPENRIRLLTEVMSTRTLRKGTRVVEQGDPGTEFFVIASGQLKVIIGSKAVATLDKHQYFGERALLFGEPRAATVEVNSQEAELWTVDKAQFENFVDRRFMDRLAMEIKMQDRKMEFGELEREKVISNGTFGPMKYVKAKGLGYALKCFRIKKLAEQQKETCLQTEAEILGEIDHPFILRFVKTFAGTATWTYELTEMVTGGDLVNAVEDLLGKLTPMHARFYFGTVFLALEYLHGRKVVYRNLQAEHILLDMQGYPKLINFTTAKKLSACEGGRTNSTVGTTHFMAPEVVQGKPYGSAVDFWGLGVLLYSLLVGELPFGNGAKDQMQIFAQVVNAKYNSHALGDGPSGKLCRELLEPKPERRLGAGINGCEEIRDSVWFQERSHGRFPESYFDRLISRAIDPPIVPPREALGRDFKWDDEKRTWIDKFEKEDESDDEYSDEHESPR